MRDSIDRAKIALRAQSVIWQLQGRNVARAVVFVAVAVVACLSALAAFNVGAFLALEHEWGAIAAGGAVGVANLALAGVLLRAGLGSRAASAEERMAAQLRDLAVDALGQDVDDARREMGKFLEDVHRLRSAVGLVTGTFVSPLSSLLSILGGLDTESRQTNQGGKSEPSSHGAT